MKTIKVKKNNIEGVLKRSTVFKALQDAKALLKNANRPETPNLARALLSGNDYEERPPSAYPIKDLISTAAQDLNNDLKKHISKEEKQVKKIKLKFKTSDKNKMDSIKESNFEDDFEKYYENELNKEVNMVYEVKEEKKSEKKSKLEKSQEEKKEDDEEEKAKVSNYFESISINSKYEEEYEKVLDNISKLFGLENLRNSIEEIRRICKIIMALTDEYENQPENIKQKVSIITLLKSLIYLIKCEDYEIMLNICESIFHIFYILQSSPTNSNFDILKYVLTSTKILFQMTKDNKNDPAFQKASLLSEIYILLNYFISNRKKLEEWSLILIPKADKTVQVKNDSILYNIFVYITGIVKNISSSQDILKKLLDINYFWLFSNLLSVVIENSEGIGNVAPLILIQIIRFLKQTIPFKMNEFHNLIPNLIKVLTTYGEKQHNELIFSILEILSKVSMNPNNCKTILNIDGEQILFEISIQHLNEYAIFSRGMYTLGNITMLFGNECKYLLNKKFVEEKIIYSLLHCLSKFESKFEVPDNNNKKPSTNLKEYLRQFSNEVLVQAIRVYANLLYLQGTLLTPKEISTNLFEGLFKVMSIEVNPKEEHLILNTASLLSNFIYFDNSSNNLLNFHLKEQLSKVTLKLFDKTENQEIIVECLRILCNLGRNPQIQKLLITEGIIEKLLNFKNFKNDISTNMEEEILGYSIGLLINLSTNNQAYEEIKEENLNKIIELLKKSDFENLELTKNIVKIFSNIYITSGNIQWNNVQREEINTIITSIGSECDSCLDVANEEEKSILNELHSVIKIFIKFIDESRNQNENGFLCPMKGCGRKFGSKSEMESHFSRRHKN